MNSIYDGLVITVDGIDFKVSITHDDCFGPPWDENDCHGPVSEWTRRQKAPGEMVLCADRGVKRFYDFQEAVKIARRDGWGVAGRTFRTPGEQAHAAALADFENLRRWCDNQWGYVVLGVSLLDDDGDEMGETEYLGGVEYDPGDKAAMSYMLEAAEDLARQIISRISCMFDDVIEPHEELSGDDEIAAEYASI